MVVLANHSIQAKEVSINDRPPDLSFVEQLSRRSFSRINPMSSEKNTERDKYLLSLLQLRIQVIHKLQVNVSLTKVPSTG
jgi:phosphopantetheinyl transferase